MLTESILKEQNIRWITFKDFISIIKLTTLPPHWSGTFNGISYTHENDQLYLIGGGYGQVNFKWDTILCFLEDGTPFILPDKLLDLFIK